MNGKCRYMFVQQEERVHIVHNAALRLGVMYAKPARLEADGVLASGRDNLDVGEQLLAYLRRVDPLQLRIGRHRQLSVVNLRCLKVRDQLRMRPVLSAPPMQ